MFKRISSFLIDYFIILFCASPFLFLTILGSFDGNISLTVLDGSLYAAIVLIAVFSKDLFYKKCSIGKKIMGLEIRNISNQEISKINLVLRNLTTIIWPIEFLVLLITKTRISDKILNLEVIEVNNPNLFGKFILGIVKTYFYLLIFMLLISIPILLFS